MEAISASNISKTYAGRSVLRGVRMSGAAGSRLAIYGPTGAGKTTLLHIVAGLVRPDGGEVSLFGEMVTGNGAFVPPDARGLGVVFQKALLWPHMKVRENVEFALCSSGLPRARRRETALEALELFGVADLSRRRPETLSGGQAQRVALARSIAARPRILLWDEPFTALDDETFEEIAAKTLDYLRKSATTLVMVSHRREETAALEAQVLLLKGGKIVEES